MANNTPRTALVTGGSRGIGAAICAELAARGVKVLAPKREELDLADVDVSGNLNGFEVLGVAMSTNSAAALIRAFGGCGLLSMVELEIPPGARLVESDLAFDPCPMIREGMMVEVMHGPLRGER